MKKKIWLTLLLIFWWFICVAINTRQSWYRSVKNTTSTVNWGDNWASCKIVRNDCWLDVFVPTKTNGERQNVWWFVYNHPDCIMIRSCITNPLTINCTMSSTSTATPLPNWWNVFLNATTLRAGCTQTDLLLRHWITWRDADAKRLWPRTNCTAIWWYYFLYNAFFVPTNNAIVEVAGMADDQMKAWIWKNMDKSQGINWWNPIMTFYPNTLDAWKCGAKYWKTTSLLPKWWHTIVLLIDDTKGAYSAGIISVKVNWNIVLSSKDDWSWCGWNTTRQNESDRKINPGGNICIENYWNWVQ